jgi:SulP family sulfate permease
MRRLVDASNPMVVAIDFSAVPDLEYTALKMLSEAVKRLRDRGLILWLVGLNPGVLRMVQQSELSEILGRQAMHFNLELAVTNYLAAPATARA